MSVSLTMLNKCSANPYVSNEITCSITTTSEQFKMHEAQVLYLETTFQKIQDRICNE